MAVGTQFDNVRQALVGTSTQQGAHARDTMRFLSSVGKIASVSGALVGTVALVASAVFFVAHPIICSLGIIATLTLLIASHDAYKISSNLEQLFSSGNSVSGWISRITGALTPDMFVDKVFERTVLAGSILRWPAVSFLKSPS